MLRKVYENCIYQVNKFTFYCQQISYSFQCNENCISFHLLVTKNSAKKHFEFSYIFLNIFRDVFSYRNSKCAVALKKFSLFENACARRKDEINVLNCTRNIVPAAIKQDFHLFAIFSVTQIVLLKMHSLLLFSVK